MKKRLLAGFLAFAMIVTSMTITPIVGRAAVNGLTCWTENSLVKVLPVNEKTESSGYQISLEMAKNEYEDAQIVLKDNKCFTIQSVKLGDLTGEAGTISKSDITANFVEYMTLTYSSVSWWRERFYDNYKTSYGNVFPEKLLNNTSMEVKADTAQSIWVTVNTKKDTAAGVYTGNIQVNTTEGNVTVPVSVTVHNVTVPDASEGSYKNISWAGTAGWTGEESRGSGATTADPVLCYYLDIEKYSTEWWNLMGEFAKQMKSDRITSYWVPTTHLLLDGGSTVDAEGNITFNWDKFDEVISFFLKNGSFNVLEGAHFLYGGGIEGYDGYAVNCIYYDTESGTTKRGNLPFTDSYVQSYSKKFFKELDEHLKAKGWDDIWMQYLGDEPINETFTSQWITAREDWMRAVAPDMKVHVAVNNMTAAQELQGHVDTWVPILNVQDTNMSYFNARRNEDGTDLMNYICGGEPCQYYMNRHIDMPYAPMHLLAWYNYKQGLSGTLNWAYNFWWKDNATTGNPGDNGIVYPDPENNSLIGSVRGASMRDGIEEYELFKLLGRSNERLADSMINTILPETSGNSQYVVDPDKINEVRLDLIKVLAGEEINLEKYPTEHKTAITYSANDITMDGNLTEDAWFYKNSVGRLIVGNKKIVNTDFSTSWDKNNLYIGLQTKAISGNIGDITNESVSFYLSPDNNRSLNYRENDFQIQIANKGATVTSGAAGVGKNDTVDTSKIQVQTQYGVDGYTMEIAVPWSETNLIPTDGKSLGLDIMIFADDSSNETVMSWSGDTNNWKSPANFGEISLKSNNTTKAMTTVKAASSSSINMDGLLEESVWDEQQKLDKLVVGNEKTIDASFSTAWTEDDLYIGLEVKNADGNTRNFKKDTMTFYLAPNNYRGKPYSSSDFQIQISNCGKTIKTGASGVGKNDTVDCSSIKVASNYTSTGYTMEISMPWSEIGLKPQDNSQLGFEIMAFDNHGASDIDLYSATPLRNTPIYSEQLSQGQHTVTLLLTGNHNDAISTSAGAGYVSFDGIGICDAQGNENRIDDSDAMFEYSGFTESSNVSYYQGALHSTNIVGSSATFTFTGDNFTIYGGEDDWSGMPRVIVDGENSDANGAVVEWSGGNWIDTTNFGTLSLGSEVVADVDNTNCHAKTDKRRYAYGEDIRVTYDSATVGGKDWIAVYEDEYAPGQDSTHPSIVWRYVSDKTGTETFTSSDVSSSTHPSFTNMSCLPAGTYKVYLLQNDGYGYDGNPYTFNVAQPESATLDLDKTSLSARGFNLTASYNNSYTTDKIGIYKKGETPGVGVTPQAEKTADGINGSVTFTNDDLSNGALEAGNYEVIMTKANSYEVLAKRAFSIVVQGITLDQSEYTTDFTIQVNYAGSEYAKDWVGIYKKGTTPSGNAADATYAYKYLTSTDGSVSFTQQDVINYAYSPIAGNPLPEGEYEIIYMQNDSYTVLQRVPFTITKAKNIVEAPSKVVYERTGEKGFANGNVSITAPINSQTVTEYKLYWGQNDSKLADYEAIGTVAKSENVTTFKMRDNTYIPPEADSLLVYGVKNAIESDEYASVAIPAADKITSDQPITSFEVGSDSHVTSWDSMMNTNTETAFADIAANGKESKAFFLVGDAVDTSTDASYAKFTELFQKYNLPKSYFSIGNHEYFETVSNPYLPEHNSYTCVEKGQKFLENMSKLGNAEALYYDTYLDGYHCIVMGSEQTELKDNYATISKQQFDWLRKTLKKTTDSNQPIFLFLHQSMRNTVSGSTNGQNWYGLYEEQETELRGILKEYPQVVMFNGHTHWTLDDQYAMCDNKTAECNIFNTAGMGSIWSDEGSTIDGSQGLYVEVYSDKVLIRGRDFKNGVWKANAAYMIPVKKSEVNPTPTPPEESDEGTSSPNTSTQVSTDKVTGNKISVTTSNTFDKHGNAVKDVTTVNTNKSGAVISETRETQITEKDTGARAIIKTVTNASGQVETTTAEIVAGVGSVKTVGKSKEVKLIVPLNLVTNALADTERAKTNVKVTLPKEDMISELKDRNQTLVNIDVALTGIVDSKQVSVLTLPKEILQAAKEQKKSLSISVHTKNECAYTWYFDSNSLSKVKSIKKNMDLMVSTVAVNKVEEVSKLKVKGCVVSIKQSGKLPVSTSLHILVADDKQLKQLKSGKKAYVYAVDSKTGRLKQIPNNKVKIDKNGYVNLNVMYGDEYVVLSKKADSSICDSLT